MCSGDTHDNDCNFPIFQKVCNARGMDARSLPKPAAEMLHTLFATVNQFANSTYGHPGMLSWLAAGLATLDEIIDHEAEMRFQTIYGRMFEEN